MSYRLLHRTLLAGLLAMCLPAVAATVSGVVTRVTKNGLALDSGSAFKWSAGDGWGRGYKITLLNGDSGDWSNLQSDDNVNIELDNKNTIVNVTVIGRKSGQRIEQPLATQRPVQGDWDVVRDKTINCRVFDTAADSNYVDEDESRTVVFSKRDSFDVFEAWVGLRGGKNNHGQRLVFSVRGDGQELWRSKPMTLGDAAVRVSVLISGYSGISLVSSHPHDGSGWSGYGLWAEPTFVKLPAKAAAASGDGEVLSLTPHLSWNRVPGATGYLVEAQCIRLDSPSDARSPERFVIKTVGSDTTSVGLDTIIPGKWQWRIHALSDTGLLAPADSWTYFTAR